MKGKSVQVGTTVKDIKSSDLMGGNLVMVASLCMLRDSAKRLKFLQLAKGEKTHYSSLQNNYHQLFGYKPADECLEWARISKPYFKFYDDISDVWGLGDGLLNFGEKNSHSGVDQLINDWHFVVCILTGLELLGHDGGGDRCFLSTLPSPIGTTEVYHYDHEIGKIDDCLGFSFAHFIAEKWGSDDFLDEDDHKKNIDTGAISKKTLSDFMTKARQLLKKRSYYHDPVVLFKRIHWMIGHPLGSITYKFANKMADAPTYQVWQKEIDLIAKEPVLANYWMLAHYFLGNNKACRVTIEEAKKAPGEVTKKLAVVMQRLLDDPKKAKLGQLKPAQLEKLKQETRKNSLPELLEPESSGVLPNAISVIRLERAEYKNKISNEDPWKLMKKYPLDVDLHDAVLNSIIKKDKKLGEVIGEYFEERSRDAYHEWPYAIQSEHKKLSLPAAAAFRSGLRYNSDHVKAFAGLTCILGKLDNDHSMSAYAEAMRTLNPDDERLDYVIGWLSKSKHSRAKEIMRIGAWRFFDQFGGMVKSIKKTQAEGPNLNNIFKVHSHLHNALNFALNYGDDESEKLADTVLDFRSNLRALGGSIGRALRVAGNRKLVRYTDYAKWYCTATSELENDDLEKSGSYNLAEAAIAIAKLAPKDAKNVLRKIFDKKYSSQFYMLDMRAGALAGLLILEPENPEFLEWATRILGNRSENMRVFGPLRAIDEARIRTLAPQAKPHLYGDSAPVDQYPFFIRHAARKAIESATGVVPPLFNDEDDLASNVTKKNLSHAIKQPEKYLTAYVFERIVDAGYRHPDIVKNGVEYLLDTLRYSSDEQDHGDDHGIWNAIKALALQGTASLAGMAQVLELPYVKREWYGNILYSMRVIEPEAEIVSWLLQSSPTKILNQLEKPEPRFMPWLDLLAAFAFAQQPEKSRSAVEKALAFRYQYTNEEGSHAGWEQMEPTLIRLPRVYVQFGKPAQSFLAKLLKLKSKTVYPKEFLTDSIKRAKQLQLNRQKAKTITTNGKIKLMEEIKGSGYDQPVYSISIQVEGKKLIYGCKVEQLNFQDMVENETLESRQTIAYRSVEEALVKANLLSATYAVLGYQLTKKK